MLVKLWSKPPQQKHSQNPLSCMQNHHPVPPTEREIRLGWVSAADWRRIKAAYQRGEGSCRVLAERFGVSRKAMEHRCHREGWKKSREKIGEKVEKKIEADLVGEGTAWVRETLRRAVRVRENIDASRDQFATDPKGRPVIDMLNIKTMLQAEQVADNLARRALGLPDRPQMVDISSGGHPFMFINWPFYCWVRYFAVLLAAG